MSLHPSSKRPPVKERSFSNSAVEKLMAEILPAIADPELGWLFHNCLPNTLDTTVQHEIDATGTPDTFVITGDIPAMWLRDSAAQVWPHLPLIRHDDGMRRMVGGVVERQARSILLDPYANAFYREPVFGHWRTDRTEMKPGVHERKWELDSLAYFLRLSHGYWTASGDLEVFGQSWLAAVGSLLALLRMEQSVGEDPTRSPYRFERPNGAALPNGGYGLPSRNCGLIRCAFRPSDDMVIFPFLVPANAMMAVALRDIVPLLEVLNAAELSSEAKAISAEIEHGLESHGIVHHPIHGEIWAYEVDGLGGANLMDDANVPSLLSLPYLGFCEKDNPRYLRTRSFCLSADNPYFSRGENFAGIGSPHTPKNTIWPIALCMQALTAMQDDDVRACLAQLRTCHAGTGFMHESFQANDPADFTRPWFAWANTLFGELVVTLSRERPHLLRQTF